MSDLETSAQNVVEDVDTVSQTSGSSLMLDLSKLLGRPVDLVSKKGLKLLIRASILEEARLVYAA
jgi:predicted nucleotidyltransferase